MANAIANRGWKVLAALLFLSCFAALGAEGWTSEAQAAALMAEMREFFAGNEVRLPGSPGNLAIEEKVAQAFAATGLKNGAIRFTAPAFTAGAAALVHSELGSVAIHPLHPSLVRPGNFAEDEFDTRLLYLGRGESDDLEAAEGKRLKGGIALMDFDCGADWLRLLRFGLRGFVFIAPEEYDNAEAKHKLYDSEINVPRFLVGREAGLKLKALAEAAADGAPVRLKSDPSSWRNVELRTPWVIIPGSDPDLGREAFVFYAPLDSNCIVPEMAQGGQSGANLFLLMKLLAEFKERPPARTVLLAAVNAHTQGYLGERLLAWHLAASSQSIEDVRKALADEVRAQQLVVDTFNKIELDDPAKDKLTEQYMLKLRTLVDDSTGKNVTVKEPIVKLTQSDLNTLKKDLLHLSRRLKAKEITEAEKEQREKELNEHKERLVSVLILFNKVGWQKKLTELAPDERAILKSYVDRLVRENSERVEMAGAELDRDTANGAIREALEGRKVPIVFSLELAWRGRLGLSSYAANVNVQDKKWPRRFGLNSFALAEKLATDGRTNLLAPSLTLQGGKPEGFYFREPESGIRFFHATSRAPALSLCNVHVDPGVLFTPADTFENLDPAAVDRSANFARAFFRSILDDRDITAAGQLQAPSTGNAAAWTILAKTYKFAEFTASVRPEEPVAGSILVLGIPGTGFPGSIYGDVVNAFFTLTDKYGSSMMYGVDANKVASVAYRLDERSTAVDHVIDLGEAHDRFTSDVTKRLSQTLALFACKELPIWVRNDPSRVGHSPIANAAYHVLSASYNSAPRRFGVMGASSGATKVVRTHTGPAAVYIEEHDPIKILADRKRVAIRPTTKEPEGEGYSTAVELGADYYAVSARDNAELNKYRLGRLSGVTNELATDLLKEGNAQLVQLEGAVARRDHVGYLRTLYNALGAQVKAYEQVARINNDMLKAIVFYMALLLPFCFFVMKLLFKLTRIEAQMAAFGALFVTAFAAFRFIHPAFRIATNAEAIFIAFIMGSLGAFVIVILHARFEGEMQALFQTYLGMGGGEVGYSTVGQKAMLIGVNNMKRRRIRTALTTATIVLVTFAMLSFSSISQKMSPTIIPMDIKPPYTGIFFQWPGSLRMDEASLQVFKDMFAGEAEELVVRRWIMPTPPVGGSMPYALYAEGPDGKGVEIEAALGLPMADWDFLSQKLPLLAGGRFFTDNTAFEMLLPAGAADSLGIDKNALEDAVVTFRGREFKVVGILDDEEFSALRDLNKRKIIPIKSISQQGFSQTSRDASLKVDPTKQDESGIFHAGTNALLIMPEGTAKRLGGEPQSISIKLADNTPIWAVMNRILTVTEAKFFIASKVDFSAGGGDQDRMIAAGVYYVGSGYKTSIGGMARLIIPLLIAGTIILNTMLGSVYERKFEIAIYNAIGLNPTHIGLFFLAEAFVYSVIGSVGGYLIGQILALGLTHFDLVSGLNLNFSSLTVVYVILFTIVIVLLSTLYPAVVATRAAVPSGKRTWSLPEHDGETMEVVFPFIYQPKLLLGVLAYLQDYFARFTEASIGELIASLEEEEADKDDKDRARYRMRYDIALAPYDLGVTQKVTFVAAFDEVVQSYRITMTIVRASGQDSNWVTTNKPFLEKMRKHLMQWRNMTPEDHAAYTKTGKSTFGGQA